MSNARAEIVRAGDVVIDSKKLLYQIQHELERKLGDIDEGLIPSLPEDAVEPVKELLAAQEKFGRWVAANYGPEPLGTRALDNELWILYHLASPGYILTIFRQLLDTVVDELNDVTSGLDDAEYELTSLEEQAEAGDSLRRNMEVLFGQEPDMIRVQDWIQELKRRMGPVTPVQGLLELLATSNT